MVDAANVIHQAKHRRWRRGAVRLAGLLSLVYLLLVGTIAFFEEALIFFPDRKPFGRWDRPGVERAEFKAADGARLHGWYLPHPNPRAVLLFACGNAGNISYRGERLEELRDRLHVSLMAFDYRGYGLSQGEPNEAGILADARAARKWLAERAGVAESAVVLLGESLGGGVMVDLAAHDGARGLILERTFTSLPDVAAWHYPAIPVRLLMRNRLDSLAKIGGYQGPLLQCHGDADDIIPPELGRRLFDAANEPKRFVLLPGVGHNDPLPALWNKALGEFIAALP